MEQHILDEQTKKLMQYLGYDLTTIRRAMVLFERCIEEEFYSESKLELFSFLEILICFIGKIKKDYEQIQDKLDIIR